MVKRGQVWLVTLDPTVGHEIRKARPCVVLSPPELLEHLRTVLVAPMTTGSQPAPFRIPVTHRSKTGLILLEQLRSVDRVRLIKQQGSVSATTLTSALSTLQEMFAV